MLELIGITNFTRTLLGMGEGWPRGDRVLRGLLVVCVVLCVASLLLPQRLSEAVMAPFGLVVAVASLVAGVRHFAQGSIPTMAGRPGDAVDGSPLTAPGLARE